MRETGRGREEGVSGVTVAAAVAILERQQEEQRRTAPSVAVRHRQQPTGDLNRPSSGLEVSSDSSDSSVNKGGTVARLQSRFSAGSVSPSSSVKGDSKPEIVATSGNGVIPKRNYDSPGKKTSHDPKAPINRVLTENKEGFNEICKSSSLKNITSLARSNNSYAVSLLNNVTLSNTKDKDEQEKSYNATTDSANKLGTTSLNNSKKILNDKISSVHEQLQSNSPTNDVEKQGELQRSSSTKDSLHHEVGCDYDDDTSGATCLRTGDLDNSVKGSISDSNIPRKQPRVINLRASSRTDGNIPKSNPEVTSHIQPTTSQKSLSSKFRSTELGSPSHNSSVRIVLEYPPPPLSSPPPRDEESGGSPLTGGFSPGSSRQILASPDSLAASHIFQRPPASIILRNENGTNDEEEDEDDDSGTCSASSGSGSGTEHIHMICDRGSSSFINEKEQQLVRNTNQGGDESSSDEEEEDSTLKCSGTAWSGSDSAPRHRSSSTSDFSSSSSSEEETEDLDHPSHSPCRPSEDLTTTGCDEDFQWVRSSSAGGMEGRRQHLPIKKSDTAERRVTDVRTPDSDDSKCNHQDLDYDPPQIMQNRNSMAPSYEKVTSKCEVQNSNNEGFEYRQLNSDSSEVVHRKPPRHDSGLRPPVSFDKASSLDRRRHHGHSRASRDQKARSSILLHSPRYQSPSRHASPAALECLHYNNTPCCNEGAKIIVNHSFPCCDPTAAFLRCSSSHESIHQPTNPVLCNEPTHCCSSSSLRDDVMASSYESSFSDNHHHHHHHSDLQRYGSAGKLDCHARICHGIGSQQDFILSGGDCYGSHGCLPLCSCHAEQRCRWRNLCKQPPPGSDVEERLRRLEADKDSLQLQVTVLTEQIEAQTDKISDLEKLLDEKKRQLANAEDVLQREMLSRSSLETQKLELLSAMSELKLQQAALERDNLELRDRLGEERRRNKPPVMPRTTLLATSTPISSQQTSQLLGGVSPSPSPVSSLSEGSPRRLGNHPNSVEDFKDIPAPRTPPANYRRKVEHYGSLPRQRAITNGTAVSPLDGITPPANAVAMRKGVAFAQTERVVIEDVMTAPSTEIVAEEEEVDATSGTLGVSPQPSPSFQAGKSKGIKKIFGRIKRSGSGNLDDLLGEGEFQRGGVRATAGPRLGWTNQPLIKQKPDQPFVEWDSDAICWWLQELGLDCYASDAKRWVKSGAQLLQASNHELEKELGVKNPLHRKKLHLALLSQQEAITTLDPHLVPAGELDTAWVLRWLDDAGLPQHKETFLAARIDGRVLHRLTMDELAILHVTSHLHVASLRRGIQVLRDHKFEANCLKRRSLPDDPAQPTAQDVALWTNHRVMEWLRIVDLAEYAPNLRGSGVHGGLMVHEPRFTAEFLASLLSIPPSKTLLRRHLNTHFKELLGRDCIQEKREAEATLGYVPLSATTKVKVTKKSQFTLKRKKSKSELDFGDLVCPLDPNKSDDSDGGTTSKGRGCLS